MIVGATSLFSYHITLNIGMNIFSSSQPLYMLLTTSCVEIIQPNNTVIFGCESPS